MTIYIIYDDAMSISFAPAAPPLVGFYRREGKCERPFELLGEGQEFGFFVGAGHDLEADREAGAVITAGKRKRGDAHKVGDACEDIG